MGDALRRLFLGLGVALGLASGQPDPSIVARAAPDGGFIVVDVRIENAFAPGAIELVETGTRVALRYSARLEGPGGRSIEARETRALRFDARSSRYGLDYGEGKTGEVLDPQAARIFVSELHGLELCRSADAEAGSRVVVKAEIGIIDSSGQWHDAPVLWNYFGPRAVLVLGKPEAGGR
jgi:hypothetical protein